MAMAEKTESFQDGLAGEADGCNCSDIPIWLLNGEKVCINGDEMEDLYLGNAIDGNVTYFNAKEVVEQAVEYFQREYNYQNLPSCDNLRLVLVCKSDQQNEQTEVLPDVTLTEDQAKMISKGQALIALIDESTNKDNLVLEEDEIRYVTSAEQEPSPESRKDDVLLAQLGVRTRT